MAVYGVSIALDTASPFAKAVARGIERRSYGPAVGEAGKLVLMDHFAGKEAQAAGASQTAAGNPKLGHVGLYADFARATSWRVVGDGVEVSINHPAIHQRLRGGIIKPVNASYLTLPAREGAYGKRVAEIGIALKFGFAFDDRLGVMRKALIAENAVTKEVGRARKDGTRRTKTVKEAGVYYWLVRSVNQEPDDTVLPYDELIVERVAQAFEGWAGGFSNGG